MFNTIAMGLDGSDAAERCIPIVTELAKQNSSKVVIVHIEERVFGKGGAYPMKADEDEIRTDLAAKAKEMANAGIDVRLETGVVVIGGPAQAIAEIAANAGADLIVVASNGHTPVVGMLLGSVAQRLLHLAKQPVLLIPVGR